MKLLFYCILAYIFITTSRSSLFSIPKANVLSLIKDNGGRLRRGRAIPRARDLNREIEKDTNEQAHFQIDPILNSLRRRSEQKQRRFKIEQDNKEKAHFHKDILNSFRKHGIKTKPRSFPIDSNTNDKAYFRIDPVASLRKQGRRNQARRFQINLDTHERGRLQINPVDSHPKQGSQNQPERVEIDLESDEKGHLQIDPVNSLRKQGRGKQSESYEIVFDTDDEDGKFQIVSRRHASKPKISRRKGFKASSTDSLADTSSSREFRPWKDEWKEHWIEKKFEAANSSYVPGDAVNMLSARPWGIACGDPNVHDMPWGTCMLPQECDAEYRIYRGDYHCGRTQYVCCSMQVTIYDQYEGFDPSFEDYGLVDSDKGMKEGSKEDQKKRRQVQKMKRIEERHALKKRVERKIKKIQKEIKNIIIRQERNATEVKKQKTRQIKRFYDLLKHQYDKDREAIIDVHDIDQMKMDDRLMVKLDQIRDMNREFIHNLTFRDIIVNGTLNKKSAKMLVEAYPELESYINIKTRRTSGGGVAADYLDDDVEYGVLYW